MNWIDVILIAPLAYAGWKGFQKGLIIEVFGVLSLLVGLYAGINFSDWASDLISSKMEVEPRYLPVVAFTLTFIGVAAMVYFLGKLIERSIKAVHLGMVNKLLGLFFGVVKVLFFLSAFLVIIESYNERLNFIPEDVKDSSLLYYPVQKASLKTIPSLEDSKIWLENLKS